VKTSLVKFSADAIEQAVEDVITKKRALVVPKDERPLGLNDINLAGYALLEEALYDLQPKELQFVAQMARASYITEKQRKWLKDIAKKYLAINIDGNESGLKAA
jgi:hypothetical protein